LDFPKLETLIEEQNLLFCDGPGQHTFTIEQIPTSPGVVKITVLLNEGCHCEDGDTFIAYTSDPDDSDVPIQEEGWYFSEK
jgi:hypothetical protein